MLEQTSPEKKIQKAFQLIICRTPTDKETSVLEKYYTEEHKRFATDEKLAKDFIQAGEYRHEDVRDVATLAATMQIVHTLYNMDEAITK